MSSAATAAKALLAGLTALPRVSCEPTFKYISLACHILNQNTIIIQSYDGEADHGHIQLIMAPIEYIMKVPVGTYNHQHNPGPTAEILDRATLVMANIMVQ
jgi:hypothetical protein